MVRRSGSLAYGVEVGYGNFLFVRGGVGVGEVLPCQGGVGGREERGERPEGEREEVQRVFHDEAGAGTVR